MLCVLTLGRLKACTWECLCTLGSYSAELLTVGHQSFSEQNMHEAAWTATWPAVNGQPAARGTQARPTSTHEKYVGWFLMHGTIAHVHSSVNTWFTGDKKASGTHSGWQCGCYTLKALPFFVPRKWSELALTVRPNQKRRKEHRKSETALATTSCNMVDSNSSNSTTSQEDDLLNWDFWLNITMTCKSCVCFIIIINVC